MSAILQLQKLPTSVSASDFNIALASSLSVVCPTTAAAGEFHHFELD
jgi:hypothetical protein